MFSTITIATRLTPFGKVTRYVSKVLPVIVRTSSLATQVSPESVEYSIIGKPAFEAINGQYDFTSRMADTQSKANQQIKEYKDNFNAALAKFEKEFAAK